MTAGVGRVDPSPPGAAHRSGDAATLVLLYHRVAEAQSDPQLLCVSPQRFVEHLRVARSIGEIVPVSRLAAELVADGLPAGRRLAITFDDGYRDNLTVARPLLEAQAAPATVFVASGYMGGGRCFWWDDLERLLLHNAVLPARLALTLGGKRRVWDLEPKAGPMPMPSPWTVLDEPRHPRQMIYRDLADALRPLRPAERDTALVLLREWAGPGLPDWTGGQPLSAEELVRLAGDGLVEIGSHTAQHALLSTLPAGEQFAQIASDRAALEGLLGRPVTGFSYPYGCRGDFTDESVAAVARAGLTWACVNRRGLVRAGADVFRLPRMLVRNWDATEFARRVEEAFASG